MFMVWLFVINVVGQKVKILIQHLELIEIKKMLLKNQEHLAQ